MPVNRTINHIFLPIFVLGAIIAIYIFTGSQSELDLKDTHLVNISTKKSVQNTNQKQVFSSAKRIQLKDVGTTKHQIKKESNPTSIYYSDIDRSEQEDVVLAKDGEFDNLTDTVINQTGFQDIPPTIDVSGDANELYFVPESEMDYESMEVVIALPNGKQIKQKFKGNELVAVVDKGLSDGSYVWETNITPKIDSSIRKEMANVRAQGNLQEEQKLIDELREGGYIPSFQQAKANTQSGHFTVIDGVIIMPDNKEKPFRNKDEE